MGLANVVIVEDDSFLRTMLSATLTAGGFVVRGAGSTAKYALEVQAGSEVEVAILDIDLGAGPTGVDIAYALREINPKIGIVLLTSFSDPRLSAAQGMRLPQGTRYLTKSTIQEMSKLLTIVLQAKFAPLKDVGTDGVDLVELTTQQISALKLVAAGATNAEIARQLEISEKAVEHLISRINDNLGLDKSSSVNTRVQLVRKFSDLAGGQLP
jgi:DNA-binding NarL/FixJ family response regulator